MPFTPPQPGLELAIMSVYRPLFAHGSSAETEASRQLVAAVTVIIIAPVSFAIKFNPSISDN